MELKKNSVHLTRRNASECDVPYGPQMKEPVLSPSFPKPSSDRVDRREQRRDPCLPVFLESIGILSLTDLRFHGTI